jgi:hypothetical protein
VAKLEGNMTISIIIGGTRQGRFSEKLRYAGIQLRHIRGAEERDRLGLPGVEPQGRCLRELRQRHGRPRRPAASRDGHRASDGAGSIVRSHSRGNAVGAFPGWGRREGAR